MAEQLNQRRENLVRQCFEELSIDLSFETLTWLLIDQDTPLDQVQVIPYANHQRNYRNDVTEAPKEFAEEASQFLRMTIDGFIHMFTSRPAILDYLPEDFYAEPDNSHELVDELGQSRPKRDIERHREEQKERQESARLFFRPIEVACNRVRLEREQEEVASIQNMDKLLHSIWGKEDLGSAAWVKFIRSHHLISYIIGDLDRTEALITYVLGTPVKLQLSQEPSTVHTREDILSISQAGPTLGYNMRLGNTVYDYEQRCSVSLKALTTKEFYFYYTEESGQDLLITIARHYFPMDVVVEFDFEINTDKDPEGMYLPVLGFSTYLHE